MALLQQRLQAGAVARIDLTLPRIALAKAGVDYADASRQAAEARTRTAEALGLAVRALEGVELDFPLPLAANAGAELTSA